MGRRHLEVFGKGQAKFNGDGGNLMVQILFQKVGGKMDLPIRHAKKLGRGQNPDFGTLKTLDQAFFKLAKGHRNLWAKALLLESPWAI